jgi:polysaccharide deacetylase family protein (PEP-CTERM system associated)
MIKNAYSLTVDVEEYFQVEAYAKQIHQSDWNNFESRIEYQMNLLLELFKRKNVKATFFVLGSIAEKHPDLVKRIIFEGHELASHGFNHQHITKINKKEFIKDIRDSKALLEDISNTEIKGYRAPCFSITPENEWAHDEIENADYKYSSSTYSINHDLYGVPKAPRTPYYLDNGLLEIPVSSVELFNKAYPAAGGGFFRLQPYILFKYLLKKSEKQLGFINFYTHPWEYDPGQPKLSGSLKSNFRHNINQKTALYKLEKLCDDFTFKTIESVHMHEQYPRLGKWKDISIGNT